MTSRYRLRIFYANEIGLPSGAPFFLKGTETLPDQRLTVILEESVIISWVFNGDQTGSRWSGPNFFGLKAKRPSRLHDAA